MATLTATQYKQIREQVKQLIYDNSGNNNKECDVLASCVMEIIDEVLKGS